jgi:DivIVA domain-containing protein
MAFDTSSPASIAVAEFTTSRRGFDPEEVRTFLQAVSLEMSRVKEREASVAAELEAVRTELAMVRQTSVSRSSVDLDEATVASLLGEEAARVLTTAREGAAQLRARAEREVEADRLAASEAIERERSDAAADAARVRAEATSDAERSRLEATDAATAEVEAAKIQGRDMVFEARAYREKVMADLARRREAAQQQLDVLNLQRGRLRSSFESVRNVLDEIRAELHDGELGPSPLDDLPAISGAFPVVARMTEYTTRPAEVAGAAVVEATPEPVVVPEPVVSESVAPDPAFEVEPVAVEPDVVEPEAAAEVAEVSVVVEEPMLVVETVTVVEAVDAVEPEVVEAVEAGEVEPEVEVVAAEIVEEAKPEIVAVVEPPVEPEPEAETLAVVHDLVRVRPQARPSRPPADDVFARLRASRTDDVGQLQEAPTPVSSGRAASTLTPLRGALDSDSSGSAVAVAERIEIKVHQPVDLDSEPAAAPAAVAVASVDVEPPTAEPLAPADEVIAARREALAPVEEAMARRLKRALADEQSEILDKLRRKTKKTTLTLDDLFGSASSYENRYIDAVAADVTAAARAGALSLTEMEPASLTAALDKASVSDAIAIELVEHLVAPLRARLERAFVDSADDAEAAADQFRAVYREWKTQRIDAAASHAALAAHGRGALAALTPGTSLCWVVDSERPCAEGDDNVLGGAVAAGDDFPTGHRHAPAYMGCRCAIALASR